MLNHSNDTSPPISFTLPRRTDSYVPDRRLSGDRYLPELTGDRYLPELTGDRYVPEPTGDRYVPEKGPASQNSRRESQSRGNPTSRVEKPVVRSKDSRGRSPDLEDSAPSKRQKRGKSKDREGVFRLPYPVPLLVIANATLQTHQKNRSSWLSNSK
jgi:hypothetical protein